MCSFLLWHQKSEKEGGNPLEHPLVVCHGLLSSRCECDFFCCWVRNIDPEDAVGSLGSLQKQRFACSYYAGRKHPLHSSVTHSVTDEAMTSLNWVCCSLTLRRSQPLACATELGYLNRWLALKDRRSRGRTVTRMGIVTSLVWEPSKKGSVNLCHGNIKFKDALYQSLVLVTFQEWSWPLKGSASSTLKWA